MYETGGPRRVQPSGSTRATAQHTGSTRSAAQCGQVGVRQHPDHGGARTVAKGLTFALIIVLWLWAAAWVVTQGIAAS